MSDATLPDPEPGSASGEGSGGGEWPDPDTPPSDRAPGSDPARANAIEAAREANVDVDAGDGDGDDPLARTAKEAVEEDPVAGAVGSMARDRDTAGGGPAEDAAEPGDDAERGTDTSTASE